MKHQTGQSNRERSGILLCGAYGCGNAGDEAILDAVVAELRSVDPSLPICVMTRKPEETRSRLGVDACFTFDFAAFHRKMRSAALYLNGGGSLMQNVTSRRSLWFYLYTLRAAKKRGCKVLMYGCGIGPITHAGDRRLAARTIEQNVDAITLRDPHSRQELLDMGVSSPAVVLAADPTVGLPAASAEAVDELMKRRGLDPHGSYIGFTVRPWAGFGEKAAAFAAAADYAYERCGLTPVFVPIEQERDGAAARQVSALMKAPHHVLDAPGGSANTIGVFSRMKVVVAMRLHALMFSAGQGVPLVGVVYDPKVSSFLDYIGQDLYLDLRSVTADKLTALIDSAAARADDQQLRLEHIQRLRL